MSLKDIAKQSEEGSKKVDTTEEDMEKLKSSMLVDSAIQGSFYFLFGSLNTFLRLKGYEKIPPEKAFKELKEMDKMDREQLEESDDPLHKFLLFYFHDKN